MRRTIVVAVALLTGLTFSAVGLSGSAGADVFTKANRFAPSGTVTVDPLGTPGVSAAAAAQIAQSAALVPSNHTNGCSDRSATNVRANQECTNQSAPGFFGRGQSQNETAVAVNPQNPRNILISQNDYRFSDGRCGVNWSMNGGRTWGSELAPSGFTAPGFTAPRHYWDAGGDTSVGFDSSGEAYLMCQVFNRGSTSDLGGDGSAFIVFRSADGGASWSFPGSIVTQSDGTGADGIGLLDKEYMTIDTGAQSPFRDRIYVTWTQYSADFSSAPIDLAYSDDHGVTWTNVGTISGSSTNLCPINVSGASSGTCDNNQFSDPFVGPNGDLYVAFANFNNCAGAFGPPCTGDPNDNHNQVLIVKSTDGGATFGAPVKVSDYFDLPDCATYTGFDVGRACVPTQPLSGTSIFRAANYPSGIVLPNQTVVVNFGSYINRDSNPTLGNCSSAGFSSSTFLNLYTGVGTAGGCNNDIVWSASTNGGSSFSGTSTPVWSLPSVASSSPLTDQWFQWTAMTGDGHPVVSFYDRSYGTDESTGAMDFTLTRGVHAIRVTDASMPPSNEFPDVNGYSVFMGDYTGIAVGSDGKAHPAWEDTRNPILTFDPTADARVLLPAGFGGDIYTRSMRSSSAHREHEGRVLGDLRWRERGPALAVPRSRHAAAGGRETLGLSHAPGGASGSIWIGSMAPLQAESIDRSRGSKAT